MANPTDSELKLLKALWAQGRLSARELQDATEAQTQWSFSTTRKTLDRMEDKGLVLQEPLHGVKTYQAATSRLATMASLIRTFAKNVLDTDGPIPAATFVQSRMIDEDEIEELEQLLNQYEETNA